MMMLKSDVLEREEYIFIHGHSHLRSKHFTPRLPQATLNHLDVWVITTRVYNGERKDITLMVAVVSLWCVVRCGRGRERREGR